VFEKVCHHLSIANNEKEYFACSFKDEKRTRVSVILVAFQLSKLLKHGSVGSFIYSLQAGVQPTLDPSAATF